MKVVRRSEKVKRRAKREKEKESVFETRSEETSRNNTGGMGLEARLNWRSERMGVRLIDYIHCD